MSEKPVAPATKIITLLESNDVSNSQTAGQWSNNLNENTVLKEGDSIFVRQSMVDTTTETSGTIDVAHEEADITIQFGVYLQDSGNGAQDGGDQQTIDYLDFSQPVPTGGEVSPSGRNFILQNHTRGLPNTEIWYTGGPTGIEESENPGTSPANDFSISFIPSTGAGDWWEFTISTSAPAYGPPAGIPPFPPPESGTGPIILPENLEGLKCIFKSGVTAIGSKFAYYNIYPEGWTPASGTPTDTDHIAAIEVIYDGEAGSAARPIGYESRPENTTTDPNPPVLANRKWVFQGAVKPVVGGTQFQYWNNVDPITREESSIYRVCTDFRMIVDNFADLSSTKAADQPDAPYQTALSYTTLGGVKETVRINFSDWGNASKASFGTGLNDDYGLFFLHVIDAAEYKLPSLAKGDERGKQGFDDGSGYSDTTQGVFWVQFSQLQDTRNPLQRTLQPFIFDVHDGITALPFGTAKGANGRIIHTPGAAMGIYNPRPNGVSNAKLGPDQITAVALPLPDADGVVLTPRIFTQKISIPAITYTYEALAQELTDQFNSIPRIVPQLNNNPYPDPPQVVPTALNPVGFSGSRILSSTYELGMQQTNNATPADRVPTFPSEFTWSAGNPTAFPLKQPVWVDESGEFACQFNELSLQGAANPRWIGAEALSFIYDQSSDTFQVAQAHSNMYSRLDGGIIARQFKVNDGDLVTADKAGGIFLTSLEPQSLFFDKMKLQPHKILVSQLTGNPTTRDLKTGTLGASAVDFDQNVNLDNALTHTVTLVKGDNITGNFVGLTSKIDKRVNSGTAPTAIIGGNYGAVRTEFDLDVGVDAPITIKGLAIDNQIEPDPFYQIEISGMNRQDVVGAETKNNLIQTIVSKYFSNGGFTVGSVEDGWKYTHVGEPLLLRSLSVRILDSTGNVSTGLGPNSAVILEIDTDK